MAGTILHVVHNVVVKSCLFLVGGMAERVTGSQYLKRMGGILDLSPGLAGIFIVAALSLAGMPPFSGFLSKLVLVKAGTAGGNYVVVLVAVLTSFFTLYSMSKIWSYAFWGKRCCESPRGRYRAMMAPTAVLIVFTILIGMWAQPATRLALRAAKTLTQPEEYVRVVLQAQVQRRAPAGAAGRSTLARLAGGR